MSRKRTEFIQRTQESANYLRQQRVVETKKPEPGRFPITGSMEIKRSTSQPTTKQG